LLNLLALDTATSAAAVALMTAAGAAHGATPDPSERHGRNLLPAVRELLRNAGLTARDLGGIAVGLGPGSYTGLRIGVTAAKTLAYALGVPLVGLDSLEVLARNAPDTALLVAAVADAQRGDVYAAEFRRQAAGAPLTRVGRTRVEGRDTWLGGLAAGTLVVGPGLDRLGAPLPGHVVRGTPEMSRPDPLRLLDLAREAWISGRRDDPWALEPLYLRRSAAEEQWDQRRQS
jgi:tRNA threonylcarbamoyladenosine biosynthesis protein TsaB